MLVCPSSVLPVSPTKREGGDKMLKRIIEIVTLKKLWNRRQAKKGRR